MAGTFVWPFPSFTRRPIAVCVASAFALAGPANAIAATVTSCYDDGGPGTLRSVIDAAAEGATVDFTGLDCTAVSSTITLVDNPIFVSRNSLTIDGAGATTHLTVDASSLARGFVDNRVFTHTGNGTLTLSSIDAKGGYVHHSSALTDTNGGCIFSTGNVTLKNAVVSSCIAENNGIDYPAVGGAIRAGGDVTLESSSVSYGTAAGATGAYGGGIFATNVTLTNSTVSHNAASSSAGIARGGGVYVNGNVSVTFLSVLGYNSVNAFGDAAGAGAYVRGDFTNGSGLSGSYVVHNSAVSTHGTARGGGALTAGSFISTVPSYFKYNSVNSSSITSKDAAGGGLYVAGGLTFYFGNISGNTASSTNGIVRGGGARVHAVANLRYTRVSGNAANNLGYGGGLSLSSSTTVLHSTISGNSAAAGVGGLDAVSATPAFLSLDIISSTISGNTSGDEIGGVYVNFGDVKAYDSTIAFNSAAGGAAFSPGLDVQGPSTVLLQNTLMSNNHFGAIDNDFTTEGSVTIDAESSTNLIRATTVSLPPGSNTPVVCPLLGRLRDNGGLTPTHALLSRSPAIDHGGSALFAADYDQRGAHTVNGTVDYPRISGPIGVVTPVEDIGAYEVQQADIIFNTEFEGCNPLN